jgi:hypothetical protein
MVNTRSTLSINNTRSMGKREVTRLGIR